MSNVTHFSMLLIIFPVSVLLSAGLFVVCDQLGINSSVSKRVRRKLLCSNRPPVDTVCTAHTLLCFTLFLLVLRNFLVDFILSVTVCVAFSATIIIYELYQMFYHYFLCCFCQY